MHHGLHGFNGLQIFKEIRVTYPRNLWPHFVIDNHLDNQATFPKLCPCSYKQTSRSVNQSVLACKTNFRPFKIDEMRRVARGGRGVPRCTPEDTTAQPSSPIFKGLKMLKIKLSRVGKRKQPTFRLLVIEHQKDPWGTYIENIGHFDPRHKEETMNLNAERINYWISVGAKPTDTVHNLLVTAGIIKDKKRNVSKLGKIAREERAKTEADAKKVKMEAAAKKKESASAEAPADKEAPKAEEAKA